MPKFPAQPPYLQAATVVSAAAEQASSGPVVMVAMADAPSVAHSRHPRQDLVARSSPERPDQAVPAVPLDLVVRQEHPAPTAMRHSGTG